MGANVSYIELLDTDSSAAKSRVAFGNAAERIWSMCVALWPPHCDCSTLCETVRETGVSTGVPAPPFGRPPKRKKYGLWSSTICTSNVFHLYIRSERRCS